ncbi:MAG: hypothetical protein FJY85_04155, partial [Deltaproteobacteria bacterium]|nr:hypothetical protein [Deltaproteobacteria bacterium]
MNREMFRLIEEYRGDRLIKLGEGKGPVPLSNGKFIVHLVPEQTLLNPALEFNISKLLDDVSALPFFGDKNHPGSLEHNLEGRICRSTAFGDSIISYVQFFRNGAVEAVENFYLNREDPEFPPFDFEEELFTRTAYYLEQMGRLGVNYPVFFLLSILGAEKYRLNGHPFQKSEMHFPPKEFTAEQ